MRILVDGDVIAFRSARRAEKRYWVAEYNGDIHDLNTTKKTEVTHHLQRTYKDFDNKEVIWTQRVETEPVQNACHSAKLMMNKLAKELLSLDPEEAMNSHDISVYLTSRDRSNYRFKLATIIPYKGHRGESPVFLPDTRKYLTDYWGAEDVHGMEADDKMMIEHHMDIDNTIVCTVDKDLKNAAKWFFNLDSREVIQLSRRDNLQHFWAQMLLGDSCDNIPGLKRWMKPRTAGPKTVQKLLGPLEEDATEYYKKVRDYYRKHLIKDEYNKDWLEKLQERMTEIGNLLWIRRTETEVWKIPLEK